MVYILGVLGASVCATSAFIFLLLRYNLSPQHFVYKVASRFFVPPARLRPVLPDAPYRRMPTSSSNLHRPVLLNLQTSDGSGQACHPDIVYIPGGFGSKKWPYWMACTPYPYGDSAVENPEVFVSYDGVTWVVPDGACNPLAPTPQGAGNHNSDPDMLYHENQLWLFYRERLLSKDPTKVPDEIKLLLIKSADGVQWSEPVEVLSEKAGAQLLSPAVIHDGHCFWMWTIETQAGGLIPMRRSSRNGSKWSPPVMCDVIGLEPGRELWHIDVIEENDRLSAILVSCTGQGGKGGRIHYAHSEDQGLTWIVGGFLLEQAYAFEAFLQYRASLRKVDDQSQEYELWFSAADVSGVFSIAYQRFTREGNNLFPSDFGRQKSQTLTALK